MRTTFLLSALLLIAGHLAAQDSPITVADSSPPPLPDSQSKDLGKKKPERSATPGARNSVATLLSPPITVSRTNVTLGNKPFLQDNKNRYYVHDMDNISHNPDVYVAGCFEVSSKKYKVGDQPWTVYFKNGTKEALRIHWPKANDSDGDAKNATMTFAPGDTVTPGSSSSSIVAQDQFDSVEWKIDGGRMQGPYMTGSFTIHYCPINNCVDSDSKPLCP